MMRYRLLALIGGVILIALILISLSLRVWPFGKSKENVPELALQHLVPDDGEKRALFTGPLLDDERFINVLATTKLQEICDANTNICLLSMSPKGLTRQKLFDVLPDGRINSATRGHNKLFYVEDLVVADLEKLLLVGPPFPGEKLQIVRGKEGPETVLGTTLARVNADSKHIHSLSLSHTGNLLAFMVSGDKEWGNWDNHTLKIYDCAKKSTRDIWRGDIGGGGMIDPYKWVQPLPWSPDDKKVLLSTSNGKIISIDVSTGSESELCNGYLPIGFVDADRFLVLRRSAWWFSRSWRIIRFDLRSKRAKPIVDISGPVELRAPLVSPGGDYVCFVGCILPRLYSLGVHLYTLVLRLDDLKYALFEAEVTAWCSDPDVP